jgi:hypothetical protein
MLRVSGVLLTFITHDSVAARMMRSCHQLVSEARRAGVVPCLQSASYQCALAFSVRAAANAAQPTRDGTHRRGRYRVAISGHIDRLT